MAHFYFDLHECSQPMLIDEDGVDLVGLEAARAMAVRCARGLMSAEVLEGNLCLGCSITVRDGTGTTVLTLPFADAVTVAVEGSC